MDRTISEDRNTTLEKEQTIYENVEQNGRLHKNFVLKANPVTDTNFPAELRAVFARVITGEKGVTEYSYAGIPRMLAFTPISGAKWFVSLNVPTTEVTESISALTWISLITILFFFNNNN